MALTGWPDPTDDSGSGLSGTVINRAWSDSAKASINASIAAGEAAFTLVRAQASMGGSGTKAAVFAAAQADSAYLIFLTPNVQESFWVTGKSTTGFTINSSNATSTATVDWVLVRIS